MSSTVTMNEPEPTFPSESVTLHVTVVLPSLNVLPEPGLQGACEGPSLSSVALAGSGNVTTEPSGPFASTVMPLETVTDGAFVWFTVTGKDPPRAGFRRLSVTRPQVTVVVAVSGTSSQTRATAHGVSEPSTMSVAVAV